jgi:hypothetical protein
MAEAIGQADADLIRSADVEELARRFADRFSLEVPTLTEAALSITVDETEVDARGSDTTSKTTLCSNPSM